MRRWTYQLLRTTQHPVLRVVITSVTSLSLCWSLQSMDDGMDPIGRVSERMLLGPIGLAPVRGSILGLFQVVRCYAQYRLVSSLQFAP